VKKIRIIGLIVAAALVVNLGVGCSSKQKDIKILDDKASAQTAKAAKLEDQVTLTFFTKYNEDFSIVRKPVLDEIEKRAKDTLNIKLNFIDREIGLGGFNNALQSYMDAGTPMKTYPSPGGHMEAFLFSEDQFVTNNIDSYLNIQTLAQKKYAMDISELFPKYAPNLYSRYQKAELESVTYEGKLFAIPTLFPRAIITSVAVSDDCLNECSIKSINNLDEYEAFLKLIKQKEPELIPVCLNMDKKYMFAEQYGYVFIDNGTDLVYKWDDIEMKLSYYQDVPEYKVFKAMMDRWESTGYFKNSKGQKVGDAAAASIISNSLSGALVDNAPKTNSIQWFSGPEKTTEGSSNEPGKMTEFTLFPGKFTQRLSPADSAIVIPSNAKYPEKTLALLEWIQSSQENYDLMLYGILGKNYTLYGDQVKPNVRDDGISLKTDYDYWAGSLAFSNLDYFRSNINIKPSYKEKYKDLIQTKTKYPPHIGFCPDYTPIDEDLNVCLTRIDNTLDRREKIKEEVQKQLDDWRASKK
jgi:hypothetical protein